MLKYELRERFRQDPVSGIRVVPRRQGPDDGRGECEARDRHWAVQAEIEAARALKASRGRLLRRLKSLDRGSEEAKNIRLFLRYGM